MNARKSRAPRRKTLILVAVVFGLLLAVGLGVAVVLNSRGTGGETIRGSLDGRLTSAPDLVIDGKAYPYRQHLVNILVMGVDTPAGKEQASGFRSNGQADFLLLITVDEKKEEVSFLQIDRDTIAEITVLTVLGQDGGTREAQIALAHGFGGTRERSSQLTAEAVQRLLYGVPVDHFISLNMYDMGAIADALGGVPVTISGDLRAIGPAFVDGETILLKGEQANRFVRARYGVGDGSNLARMDRQRAFMKGFQDKLKAEIDKGRASAEKLLSSLYPYLFTNLSKGHIINLLYRVKDFRTSPVTALEGEHSVSPRGFMEFRPDSAKLQSRVVSSFTDGGR